MAQVLSGSKGQKRNGINLISVGEQAKVKVCFKRRGAELAKYEP